MDAILVTHAHFDHLGNVAAFPNATVYIQRREVEKWAWAVSLPRAMDWLKQGVSIEDLAGLLRLAGEGRLRLVDGPARTCSPGVSLVPDFDTHTYGHQHVVIRNESSGVWVVPGDVMYLYANIEGIGGDGRYVPIGLAMGSQENCMLALDELMRVTGGETSRILPGHEKLLWDRHPSHRYPDGLHMAEVCLRPGEPSLLPHGTRPPGGGGDRAVSSAVFYRDLHAAYESVVSADGMYLRTEAGQRILDAVGGAGTVVLGHGVREITDAIARHGSEISFGYGATFTNPWQEQLAEALVAMNPRDRPPGVLRLRRLGGQRDRGEDGPPVPPAVRPPRPAQGHRPLAELPREHAGHAVAVRPPRLARAVPAHARRLPRTSCRRTATAARWGTPTRRAAWPAPTTWSGRS